MPDSKPFSLYHVLWNGFEGLGVGIASTLVAFTVYGWMFGDIDDRGLFRVVALTIGTLLALFRIVGYIITRQT